MLGRSKSKEPIKEPMKRSHKSRQATPPVYLQVLISLIFILLLFSSSNIVVMKKVVLLKHLLILFYSSLLYRLSSRGGSGNFFPIYTVIFLSRRVGVGVLYFSGGLDGGGGGEA